MITVEQEAKGIIILYCDDNSVVIVWVCDDWRAACINCEIFVYSIKIFYEGHWFSVWFNCNLDIRPAKFEVRIFEYNELISIRLLELDDGEETVGAVKAILIDGGVIELVKLVIFEDRWLENDGINYFEVEGRSSKE